MGLGWGMAPGGWGAGRLSYCTALAWLLYKQHSRTLRHSFNLKLAHNNGIQGKIYLWTMKTKDI